MKLTVDILQDFIASLKLTSEVLSFSDDGDFTTLVVAKTFHARRGMVAKVNGVEYVINSVVNNESIQLRGVLALADAYSLESPFYFHGTPWMTNANHIQGAREDQKLPMIYLHEIFRERNYPPNKNIRREADLRLFFLDSANYGEWTTDNHYSLRVLGLQNLVDFFIESARKYTCCFHLTDTIITSIVYVNFGIPQKDKGNTKRVFDDELTGIELNFTLPIKNCKSN